MNKKIIKFISLFLFSFITFIFTIRWLDTINLKIDDKVLEKLVASSSNLNSENKVINSIVTTITSSDYVNPVTIILNKYSSSKIDDEEPKTDNVVAAPKTPVVYIYNTHQTEKYLGNTALNINYSVLDSGYLLQKILKKYNIYSIVENGSIQDVLNANNWNYASSYLVSRMYMENAFKKNNTLKYFIDLHRDSVNKNISTASINGKNYARTMFLLGLENENHAENKEILQRLENWLNTNYPGLSRGIYEKEGPGVNGVYNQDFSKNCILIEVGGEYNTVEEVSNSIEVIANMLKEYIEGNI